MSWIESILEIYWELLPCYETQELYKSHNLKALDYWKMELEYLLCSTWINNEEFKNIPNISYLTTKYKCGKIKLDKEDRVSLGKAFIYQLGINEPLFPLKFP